MSAVMDRMMTHGNVRWRFRNGHEPLGPFGESLWGNLFIACGYRYIPFSTLPAINGRGPRMQGPEQDILPDFQVISGSRNCYVDAKCKSGPVLFHKANELRQGVDRRCWESYQAISELSRQKCLLAVVEIWSECDAQRKDWDWRGALLLQTLGRLGKPYESFGAMRDMVLWPRSRFAEITPGTSPLYLWNMAKGIEEPDGELRSFIRRVVESGDDIQGRMF